MTRVRYPGLPDDPGHQRAAAQMDGFGAMLAFEVARRRRAGRRGVRRGADRHQRHQPGRGGIHHGTAAKLAGQEHVPPGLLRLSVGIEHVEDLWDDLDQALTAAVTG